MGSGEPSNLTSGTWRQSHGFFDAMIHCRKQSPIIKILPFSLSDKSSNVARRHPRLLHCWPLCFFGPFWEYWPNRKPRMFLRQARSSKCAKWFLGPNGPRIKLKTDQEIVVNTLHGADCT